MKTYAVGVDLGGTNIRMGLVGDDFQVKSPILFPSPSGDEIEEEVYNNIYNQILSLLKKNGLSLKELKGIGIGLANAIKRVRALDGSIKEYVGIVKSNIKVINGVNLLHFLKKKTGIPVLLENDVNVGAVGEYVTRRDRVSNLVTVYMGTGIGGGVIIDRKLYFGAHGIAMEVGHMKVEYNGPPCVCGSRGCWEAIAGGVGLVNRAKEAIAKGNKGLIYEMCKGDLNKINTKMVFDAKRKGDSLGERLVEHAVNVSKMSIVSLINLFDPDVVVLGGGLFLAQKDILLEPIKEYVRSNALSAVRNTPIEVSTLDKWGGVLGAGSLLFLDV